MNGVRDFATYVFAGTPVTVRFEAPGFADWLDEVLSPGFTRVEPDADAVTVVVRRGHVGPSDHSLAESIGSVPCFRFDREVVSLPGWQNGTTVELLDDKYGARYLIRKEPVLSVEVHADGPWPRTRASLLRVVRELAIAQSLANDRSVRLHASALECDGRVVLLTGPKGAGKTTVLAHLASATGAAVVTNDCAFVSRTANDGWEVRPVPISISVRPETLTRLPHLFHDIAEVETLMQYTLEEAVVAAERHGTITAPRRLRLSPALFARAVQGSLSAGGRLATVGVLARDEATVGTTIRSMAAGEASHRLRPMRYGLEASASPRTVFEKLVDPEDRAAAAADVITRLAGEVRCVEASVGADVLDSGAAGRNLLARLLDP